MNDSHAAAVAMTASRFRWCVRAIGWSVGELATRLDMDDASIRQMMRGSRTIPVTLAAWLERLALFHENNPRPKGWLPRSERTRVA